MKTKIFALMSCLFILCISCENEANENEINDFGLNQLEIIKDFIKVLPDEPDKVIEDISGTLQYYKALKTWGVRHHIPETHDSVDIYLIGEKPNNDFKFEVGKQVTLSADGYKMPNEIINYFESEKGLPEAPAGTEYYYINVVDLK